MTYLYYPGCSLKSTGKPYEESLRAVFHALDITLEEVDDWNCCGATAYASIDEKRAFSLAARNLALAERQRGAVNGDSVDLIAPCSACFLVLTKAQKYIAEYPEVRSSVHRALAAADFVYSGRVRVRHPLDVLVNDVGTDRLKKAVKVPLKHLRIAPYYGCQVVRPFATFDDPFNPTSMDRLLEATGATMVDWPLRTRCCGGSLSGTIPDAGLRLNQHLLHEARRKGAHAVANCCPLCQFNLECFQDRIAARYREEVSIPVVYFTQVLGLALGLSERELGLHRLFVPLQRQISAEGVPAHA